MQCPVGRGDPTPPRNRADDAICLFGCRGEHCSPVRFFRYIVISGTAATGGIVAVPTSQPVIFIIILGRGRGIPRPYLAMICLLQYSGMMRYSRQVCRERIYASRAVCPLYRNIRAAATGGIVAVPTSQPVIFIIILGRGRGNKSLPLGGKVARYAPDEGEMSGSCPLISHLR